jgi:glycosyltransferase involved in cell wall biosynthesis
MVDADEVIKLSEEKIEVFKKPSLVTVANVRMEKNHLKAVEVMKRLKERGIECQWINIGSLVDNQLVSRIKNKVSQYGLETDFLLLGAMENPYPYIKNSFAVVVISDYESWSLVITESKILNKPVISTRTSGAIEQLEDKKTGILTEFDVDDIVQRIEELFTNKSLYNNIVKNLKDFNPKNETIQEFEQLLEDGTISREHDKDDDILFVIDDINYSGGGHIASKRIINYLASKNKKITVFSATRPNLKTLRSLGDVGYYIYENVKENNLFNDRLVNVLLSDLYSKREKLLKLKMTLRSKLKNSFISFEEYVHPAFKDLFGQFSTVCVTSEGSIFRKYVADSLAKKKIQWIHTDYIYWSNQNSYTRELTKYDEQIYEKFDNLIFVSNTSKIGFDSKFPKLSNKTEIMQNIIPDNEIRQLSTLRNKPYKPIKIVTVGRLEPEKAINRIINVAARLIEEGYDLKWEIIGDGWQRHELDAKIKMLSLEERIKLIGAKNNPFIIMKSADIFALLSYYEGLPNTVYEALILGIPVFATNVGDISRQIEHGVTGWLVDNTEMSIYNGLKYLIENQNLIVNMKQNLSGYKYNNDDIYEKLDTIFNI